MFLPVTTSEMHERGIAQPDFVYVSGDAYVDHPSFGAAIITRVLDDAGYSVAFLSQPDWHSAEDFKRFGKPRLGFFVSSGNIDSMVAHYTAAKKKRSDDAYTPGGKAGKRPDRAVDVYCKRIREAYGDVPIIIGGLEASLRRFAHYDYWDDNVRESILVTSGADLISYGMGEKITLEIASRLANGDKISDMRDIRGTCYLCPVEETPYSGVECPSFANVSTNKKEYATAARIQLAEQDHIRGKAVKQRHGKMMLVQNPPMPPLSQEELDRVYALGFMRTWHPSYAQAGGVPGIEEVEFSITHNRGCFGACNFCAITLHQGRYVTSRSHDSVVAEAKKLTSLPNFKGYIHDIGGPTANFRRPACDKQIKDGLCKNRKCLAPEVCPNLIADESEYLGILRDVRAIPGIKKVFVRSGIRFDYMLADKKDDFFRELVEHHVSGQLKVAPEHCAAGTLDAMGKPHIDVYERFAKKYFSLSARCGKEQYLVPYFMSSHPGSTLNDAIELALFIKRNNLHPEQVQDFYPTPGTESTAMFYTGLDIHTLEPIYVARDPHEKALQRALLRYFAPENRSLVTEALRKAGRNDLIGNGKNCLVAAPAVQNRRTGRENRYGKENRKKR